MYGSTEEAVPQFRVYLCGPFQVERRVGETFVPVGLSEWQGRTGSRTVFKALLGCPGRQARRDVLLAMLWPDDDPQQVGPIIQKAVASVRHIFGSCLLEHGPRSNLYQLAPQEQLWVDVDAAQQLLASAEQRGRTSVQALPLLEEAAGYLTRGTFLEEEEGEWVRSKQETVERLRSRSQLWLAEALLTQGRAGQAETVLTALWERDPFDEGVLRRLLALLFQQGMKRQALRLYAQACRLFEQEGIAFAEETEQCVAHLTQMNPSSQKQAFPLFCQEKPSAAVRELPGTPDGSQDTLEDQEEDLRPEPHTQDGVNYLRAKHIQRISTTVERTDREEAVSCEDGCLPFSLELPESIMQEVSRLFRAFGMNVLRRTIQHSFPQGSVVLPFEQASFLFSLLQEQSMMENFDPQKRRTLETLLETLRITSVGVPLTNLCAWESVDRLKMALGKPSAIDMEVVKGLKNTLATYWRLRLSGSIASSDLFFATEKHAQVILSLLHLPLLPSIRVALCSLASEMALLGGMLLATDLFQFEKAEAYYQRALTFAQHTNNDTLYAAVLGRMGALSARLGKGQDACLLLQEAQHPLSQSPFFPLRAWLAAEEAEVQASLIAQEKELHTAACFAALEQAKVFAQQIQEEEETFGMYFDAARIPAYQGSCNLRLHHPDAALADLTLALKPLEALGALRRAVFLDLAEAGIQAHDVQLACVYLEQSLEIAGESQVMSVLPRIQQLRCHLDSWSEVQAVRDLDERLRSFQTVVS